MDAEVRKKISSQKKEILEGSEEWDVLYRKYYAEEMRRMGIVHQPSSVLAAAGTGKAVRKNQALRFLATTDISGFAIFLNWCRRRCAS